MVGCYVNSAAVWLHTLMAYHSVIMTDTRLMRLTIKSQFHLTVRFASDVADKNGNMHSETTVRTFNYQFIGNYATLIIMFNWVMFRLWQIHKCAFKYGTYRRINNIHSVCDFQKKSSQKWSIKLYVVPVGQFCFPRSKSKRPTEQWNDKKIDFAPKLVARDSKVHRQRKK